ncbi:GATA transcription factor 26-like [Impatiens glandulifera]|uniref:GATA transcription factor 26-like n=1 Tax=Impatiens glandulifera TaxID=253017 RepID=UPI001FB04B15|nr:GATA transcription factor 26-like [Impatiens glandulifera]
MTPSKKRRTCIAQPKVSSVEKLTRDLCIILKEQQESSQFSLSSQGDLIFENDKPMVSVEIGHGSMLIQCPSSIARGEEESEASSLSFDNKLLNEAHSSSPPFSMNSHKVAQTCPNLEADKLKRDMSQQIMGTHNPQLLYVDLSDIVNYDVFTHFLSREEQQQLLKHLPSLDTANLPHSLESMFTSIQFKENIISYQKLLSEECRPLKKLPLFNVSETKQLEQYDSIFKDVKGKGKEEKENGEVGNSTNTKRTWNNSFKFSGSAASCKSPDKIIMEGSNDKEDKSCDRHFVPKNLLSFPPDGGSLMIDSSSQFVDKPYDEDLLFVPSNSSFPEAELLILPSSTFGSKASTSNNSKVPSRFV